jgi:acyl transferase domain-containing protein/acyl carrier protein
MPDFSGLDDNADPTAPPPPSIAIIGMSGRFPKARDLAEYWENLIVGRECVTHFSIEELVAAGVPPPVVSNPRYVRSKGLLDDPLCFDAALFGFSPREAEIIDPQQRVFLEICLSALEDAGCDPDRFPGAIGIYGGQSMGTYIFNLLRDPRNASIGSMQISMGNDKDFLTTRASYKLNLTGPSVVVQSACSTSLVAVCVAYQSLLDYTCDVALAGGVSITFPDKDGYVYEEGGTYSPDGRCRAFDAQTSGLVGGNGAGVVVLKRLEDALADRDNIHAVIRGAATNNDGSMKIGYAAPSVDGQADAIATAHALGDVDPATISYVEAHGTATRLGDPIEVAALTKAFRRKTEKTGYCGIGSVKSNIGHLDAAAGIAGLIKTVLALKHRQLPPSLHISRLNPQIDFETSPFYVCRQAAPWPDSDTPRRAGINSFGIGGANAHAVIEEAPLGAAPLPPERDLALLTLSAHSASALKRAEARMASHLRDNPSINLADAAYTLQTGRKAWKHRLALICEDSAAAASLLENDGRQSFGRNNLGRGQAEAAEARIVLLFPGQGAQHLGMTRGLYGAEKLFRAAIDECATLLAPEVGLDLRRFLLTDSPDAAMSAALEQTRLTQPALFMVEYALTRLWQAWGVRPTGMLGLSIGEYAAACIAGVMDLPDALRLVSRRGALMQSLPPGDMASVPLPSSEVTPLLTAGVSLAAELGPKLCVVSGRPAAVAALQQRLASHGVSMRQIRTSHAFHSSDMDPILDAFAATVAKVTLRPPAIPFISNLTGAWITDAEATDPAYWARQMRSTVLLHAGLMEVTRTPGAICLEAGPGRSLSALSQIATEGKRTVAIASCRDPQDDADDAATLIGAVGKLWTAGGKIDWQSFSGGARRCKIALPTYPFEQDEYSLMSVDQTAPDIMPLPGPEQDNVRRGPPLADLLFAPSWRRAALPPTAAAADEAAQSWLILLDPLGLGAACVALLRERGRRVATVALDSSDAGLAADYRVTAEAEGFKRLFAQLRDSGGRPDRILHLWNVAPAGRIATARRLGFDSLLALSQALGVQGESNRPCLITIVSSGLYDVTGGEAIEAEKSLLIGPCRVIPAEQPALHCKSVDIALSDLAPRRSAIVEALLAEAAQADGKDIALRRGHRWTRSFNSLYFSPHGDQRPELPSRLRQNGVYLITGGLGGIGLEIAAHLASKVGARLVLIGRSAPPDPAAPHPALARIAAIEGTGGKVMTAAADVTDAAAMAAVVAQAIARFGAIHGVIHAAGVAGSGIMQLKSAAEVDRVLAPKLAGALVLEDLFTGAGLDFFVVCSSIATVVGEPGQAEYTSANAFLDAFVAARSDRPTRYLAINWGFWSEVGMGVRELAKNPDLLARSAGHSAMTLPGLESRDGAQAFELALNSAESQIAVTIGNFEWISRYGPPRPPPLGSRPDGRPGGPPATHGADRPGYRRPEMDTDFEAPGDDLEIGVASLFHEVLGIGEVGVNDNFFDLGGHSLLGVKLVNRIQEVYFVEIGIGELFSMPTIRDLSRAIAERGGKANRPAAAPMAAAPGSG